MADEEHCSEVFQLDEGEAATLVMSDGYEMEAKLVEKSTYNDESGPNIIEKRTLTFERTDDGSEHKLSKTDGICGTPDADPFPAHSPLCDTESLKPGREVPDGHIIGYVAEVR